MFVTSLGVEGRQSVRMTKPRILSGLTLLAVAMVSLMACGGSETPAETTVAETTVAETTVAETTVAETTVAATTAAQVTTVVAETTLPGEPPTSTGAATGVDGGVIVSAMIKNMTDQEPDPADVKCVTDKVSTDELGQMATAGKDAQAATVKVLGSLFQCNPKGLADNFAKSTFGDVPGVTPEQQGCIGQKLVEFIGQSPDIIASIAGDAAAPPPAFTKGANQAIEDCVPAGTVRDALIKSVG
jgi:hypothetical protein